MKIELTKQEMKSRKKEVLMLCAKHDVKLNELCKTLNDNGYTITYNKLYNWLRRDKIEEVDLYDMCIALFNFKKFGK